MDSIEKRIKTAVTADKDGIRSLLRDPSSKVVTALLSNAGITEDELVVLARRRDLPGEVLGAIAGRKPTAEGYKVRLALVNNPRTPRRAALGMLKYIELRDLALVTRNNMLPTELRQAAGGQLKEKLPTLPLGVRVMLARLVSEEVIKALLMDETPQLVRACFENPRIKEAVVLWAINHQDVPGGVIRFIAASPKWSACYPVRFALVRNPKTPVGRALEFVQGLKALDQRFLYNDPAVTAAVKVQIEIELEKKGQPLSPPRDEGRRVGIADEQETGG